MCTRRGTVRAQRSIVNVALTWIHLDRSSLHSLGLLHTQHRMPSIKHLSLPVPLDLVHVAYLAATPPSSPPPLPVRLPQPGCRVICCTQNAKMNVATVVVNNTGCIACCSR